MDKKEEPDWESLYHAAIYAAEVFENALEMIACNCSDEDCCQPRRDCVEGIASFALSEVKKTRVL